MNAQQSKFYQQVGMRICEARRGAEVNQAEIADVLGISRPAYVNIEQGKQTISMFQLFAVAKSLGVELNQLLPPLDEFEIKSIIEGRIAKLEEELARLKTKLE